MTGMRVVVAGNRADPGWAGVHPPYAVGYELAVRPRWEEAVPMSAGR